MSWPKFDSLHVLSFDEYTKKKTVNLVIENI